MNVCVWVAGTHVVVADNPHLSDTPCSLILEFEQVYSSFTVGIGNGCVLVQCGTGRLL